MLQRNGSGDRQQCACIIPFYNEGDRILPVLNVATRLHNVSQVICVDDGSTDGAANQIIRQFPSITVVRLPYNCGKAVAVQAGSTLLKTSHVLLLDADLRQLRAREISAAVATILSQPSIDMIILRRINVHFYARLCRGDVLFSGERILKTHDLQAVLDTGPQNYQLEIAINQYMMERRKTVYWLPSSARNTLKAAKTGLAAGLAADAAMVWNLATYQGVGAYFEQLVHFAKVRAPAPAANAPVSPANPYQSKSLS